MASKIIKFGIKININITNRKIGTTYFDIRCNFVFIILIILLNKFNKFYYYYQINLQNFTIIIK